MPASNGLRAWALAILVAIVLTQGLIAAGLLDPSKSFYLFPSFGWTGAIAGGLAFGFGMALVGTCGFGALVRLGGGSLRSLVVLCQEDAQASCCARDGGRPSGAALQEEASNCHELLRPKAAVVNVMVKRRGCDRVMYGSGRRAQANLR